MDHLVHSRLREQAADPAGTRRCTRCASALMALLAAAAPAMAADHAIIDLGTLPGTPAGTWPDARGTNADGSVIVGVVGERAFVWDGAMHVLDGAASANATSADGTVIVGKLASPAHAFRWSASTGLQDLGTLPGGTASEAADVSDDGHVVVGVATTPDGTLAWLWSAEAGMRSLGTLAAQASSAATAVSGDGRVVTGYSANHAFRWTEPSGMVDISPDIPAEGAAGARAISSDGSTIVGTYVRHFGVGTTPYQFRWTVSGGFEDLFAPGVGSSSPGHARATNHDGSRIHGALFGTVLEASTWSLATGTIPLAAWLESEGLDLSGWNLVETTAVSDDGEVLAGSAYREVGDEQVPTLWRLSDLESADRVFANGFDPISTAHRWNARGH